VLTRFTRVVTLAVTIVATTQCAWAGEETQRPVAPHRFLDNQNALLTGVEVAALIADATTTRRAFNMYPGAFRESDPLARPFVALGWTGQILGGVLFVSGDLLGRHALHNAGHHRLERVLPLVLSALEFGVAASNIQTLDALKR
jgi:hypothetical protein